MKGFKSLIFEGVSSLGGTLPYNKGSSAGNFYSYGDPLGDGIGRGDNYCCAGDGWDFNHMAFGGDCTLQNHSIDLVFEDQNA